MGRNIKVGSDVRKAKVFFILFFLNPTKKERNYKQINQGLEAPIISFKENILTLRRGAKNIVQPN